MKNEILNLYDEAGFIYLNCSLSESNEGLKQTHFRKGWNEATKSDIYNGGSLHIKTGTKLNDDSYFICVDLDNKETDDTKNGLLFFRQFCIDNKYKVDTAIEKSGNGGLHILYKVSKTQLDKIGAGFNKIIYNGVKYNLDILGINKCMISEPSNYKSKISNIIKKYEWLEDFKPTLDNIKVIPDFIYKLIIDYIDSKKNNIYSLPDGFNNEDKINDDTLTEIQKLFYILSPARFDDYDEWIKIGLMIKSFGLSFDLFLELSKRSSKFCGYSESLKKWQSFRPSKSTIDYLHYIAKYDNIEEYNKIVPIDDKPDNEIIRKNLLEMNSRYLLNKDFKLTNIRTDNIPYLNPKLIDNIDRWQIDQTIKSINIKSPYDTGKTTLITAIIEKYEPKRILWLSYRKTLTDNLLSVFKDFDFKDYQNREYQADRLICQIDSIKHLIETDLFNDEIIIPSYDLIIIDEVESILNHFLNTVTMKGENRELFELMVDIIKSSNKIISLDGDLGNRAYNFLDSFGESLSVHNNICINPRNYILNNNEINFKQQIIDDLNNGLKIVLCSLSCTFLVEFEIVLRELLPNKKLLFYTSKTGDTKKKSDLKNIDEVWGNADLVAYSPTIEAGVSFDKENYFNKIYGLIEDGSCCARAFRQMLARVRKITDNNIILLNRTYKKLNETFRQSNYYNFDEIKEVSLTLEKVNYILVKDEKTGKNKRVKQLDLYDINHIYNQVESLNSNHYFLQQFKEQIIKAGHTLINESEIKTTKDKKDDNPNIILSVEDINKDTYLELLKKQKNGLATKNDKYKIQRFYLKKIYGVDNLDENIIKIKPEMIDNYLYLIDESNKLYNYEDNNNKQRYERLNLVKQLIVDLGFKNHYDDSILTADIFDKKLKLLQTNNLIFKELKRTKILFSMTKTKDLKERKQLMGFLNTILINYGLSIKSKQTERQEGEKNKSSIYFLNIKEGLDEILDYKIRKGYKIKDRNELRQYKPQTVKIFNHLVDWKIDATKQLDISLLDNNIIKTLGEYVQDENITNKIDISTNLVRFIKLQNNKKIEHLQIENKKYKIYKVEKKKRNIISLFDIETNKLLGLYNLTNQTINYFQ